MLVGIVVRCLAAAAYLPTPSLRGAAGGRTQPLYGARAVVPRAASLDASDPWAVGAVLVTAGCAGRAAGTRTAVGRAMSGPVSTMALCFAAASAGALPVAGGVVSGAQYAAVRVATPLLLLGADLRAVARGARELLPAFVLGAAGSVGGSLLGALLFARPLYAALGADAAKAVAALCAKNVGGGLNFVAVSLALGLDARVFAASLAVDNVMALVYFPLCTSLGRRASPASSPPPPPAAADGVASANASTEHLGGALAVSLALVAAARALSPPSLDVPVVTLLAVALATAAPRALAPLVKAGEQLGALALSLFFAAAGWIGGGFSAGTLATGGAPLLAFLLALYAAHLAVVLGAGRLLARAFGRFFSLPMLLVASNANVGGPATAAALAEACRWPWLRSPALLVGNLGYAIATPIGLVLHAALARLLPLCVTL